MTDSSNPEITYIATAVNTSDGSRKLKFTDIDKDHNEKQCCVEDTLNIRK